MSDSDLNSRGQNLRDFTVQIRHRSNKMIVGTGIVVSGEHIVTCAHVVRDAGVEPRAADNAELGVYFPQALDDKLKMRHAKVICCFPQHDDDVVLLQLINGPAPLIPEQFAVLGRAELSEGNHFRSYGYSPTDEHVVTRINGVIQGTIERPPESNLQSDMVQLRAEENDYGMSGAAVLDVNPTRNLVVGIIAQRNFSHRQGVKERIGYAVDVNVLTFDPFNLPVQDEPVPLKSAPQPGSGIQRSQQSLIPNPVPYLDRAPPPMDEWVGRNALLEALDTDWIQEERRIVVLVGFGGEGKSSLVRHWLDSLSKTSTNPKPSGVFWWSFYDKAATPEAFIEQALKYLGGQHMLSIVRETSSRVNWVAAMLKENRYIFILDGLEVIQYQEGDKYGLINNQYIVEFLSFFASPYHKSLCLITSRLSLFGMMEHLTLLHRDVDHLNSMDGRLLLRRLGVKIGSDKELEREVAAWDGHALTLSLLGSYISRHHGGDISYASNIRSIVDLAAPSSEDPRAEHVRRILRHYDKILNSDLKRLLYIFSTFRLSVSKYSLARVFNQTKSLSFLDIPEQESDFDIKDISDLLRQLELYKIIRCNHKLTQCTIHPLILNYYSEVMKEIPDVVNGFYISIRDSYLLESLYIDEILVLDDLNPLIESIHYACLAGLYDEGFRMYLDQVSRYIERLGANESMLSLFKGLFTNNNLRDTPLIRDDLSIFFLYLEAGRCLLYLGFLDDALYCFEKSDECYSELSNEPATDVVEGLRKVYRYLAEVQIYLGDFSGCIITLRKRESLVKSLIEERLFDDEARRSDESELSTIQALLGYVDSLTGELDFATLEFIYAEELYRKVTNTKTLVSNNGVMYSIHLYRIRELERARQVVNANLIYCHEEGLLFDKCRCYRILGDIETFIGDFDESKKNYDLMMELARKSFRRDILIEALSAHGRWSARCGLVESARKSLLEALEIAKNNHYLLYSIDVLVGLAWMHWKLGEFAQAYEFAKQAHSASQVKRYHWGLIDANEVLTTLGSASS